MKDFLGNKVTVNDRIVFVSGRYTELNKGIIVRLTAKKAVVSFIGSLYCSSDGSMNTVTIYPSQLLVVNDIKGVTNN